MKRLLMGAAAAAFAYGVQPAMAQVTGEQTQTTITCPVSVTGAVPADQLPQGWQAQGGVSDSFASHGLIASDPPRLECLYAGGVAISTNEPANTSCVVDKSTPTSRDFICTPVTRSNVTNSFPK
jgi:hypothetical protein